MKNENEYRFAISELTGGQLNAIVKKLGGKEAALALLRDELMVQVKEITKITYNILVDYDAKVEDLTEKMGCRYYGYVNPYITNENFPSKKIGQKKVKMKIFHFNEEMSPKNIAQEMDKQGYRPAKIHELLALALEHPYLQRYFWIVAYGSFFHVRDGFGAPYLAWQSGPRVDADDFGDKWPTDYYFLAVCK